MKLKRYYQERSNNLKDYNYEFLVNSELNFMKVVQDYMHVYIENYYEEGLITLKQKEKIAEYHDKRINDYINNRLSSIHESGDKSD